MKIKLLAFAFLLAMMSNVNADPFIGQFVAGMDGEEYTLTMNKEKDNLYKGTMSIDGTVIPVSGRKENDRLIGQIHEEGETYPFTPGVSAGGVPAPKAGSAGS